LPNLKVKVFWYKSCKATRAFGVEEFEDEGLHFYIELEEGGVLFLSGQYLYDFEPVDDKSARIFPCSNFSVHRHRNNGYVIDITCGGYILEPEIMVPHFTIKELENDNVPYDGETIRNITYDSLKNDLSKRSD